MTGLIIIAELIPITGTVKQGTPSTTSAPVDATAGKMHRTPQRGEGSWWARSASSQSTELKKVVARRYLGEQSTPGASTDSTVVACAL
jgi:hypothetical protein